MTELERKCVRYFSQFSATKITYNLLLKAPFNKGILAIIAIYRLNAKKWSMPYMYVITSKSYRPL